MSVVTDSRLTIGWRVRCADIPDYESREDDGWYELHGLVARAEGLLGRSVYTQDLCDVEDMQQGDAQMVGVPMYERELTVAEFVERTDALAELARDVYRRVMRAEPTDGPYLISWEQVM